MYNYGLSSEKLYVAQGENKNTYKKEKTNVRWSTKEKTRRKW